MMKTLSLILATCSIGLCSNVNAGTSSFQLAKATQETSDKKQAEPVQTRSDIQNVRAGNYLASRFAQTRHDWKNASLFIKPILQSDLSDKEILQRAMIIAMGAGNHSRALDLAKQAKALHPDESNTIAETFLIVEAFKKKEYTKAETLFSKMDNDATIRFIGPFIKVWIDAAQGNLKVQDLKQNTVQLYHAILVSDYLDDHTDVEKMIDKAMNVDNVSISELERIADLYAHVGMMEKATNLYKKALTQNPDDEVIKNKIDNIKKDTTVPLFKKVENPNQGMAQAFYDIANILYNEKNDESARVFAQIAIYLAPELTQTTFLIAGINARHKQYDEAIALYNSIPQKDENYVQAQYDIVDIYDETEQFSKALAILNKLSKKETDPDTLIKIGNLYRHKEQYAKSLELYDRAIKALGGETTAEYWHLHYVRGISYEQTDQWENAEQELSSALKFQPDHPYILNYLGYSWVDRGINLDEATAMIQKAVDARPNDGYITDSLGWAMYRNSDFKNAAKVLERAVELLPYDPTINDHLGDAYWKVGRRLEARFQWERAKNNSDDQEQIEQIEKKLKSGLPEDT